MSATLPQVICVSQRRRGPTIPLGSRAQPRDFLVPHHIFPKNVFQRRREKVVLASSASQTDLDHYLDLLQVRDVVIATTSSAEVEKTKPAPDIFATALAKLS